MESRTERCSGCGQHLIVPPHAKTIRCSLCQVITPVRYDPFVRAHDHVRRATNWFKGLINNVSTNTNLYASSMNYQGTAPMPAPVPPCGYRPTLRTLVYPSYSSYPSTFGKKRALLCGISYRSRRYELKGSINDVNCMRYLLRDKLGFPDQSILVLTEDEIDPYRIPTKQNIRMAMRWLVQGCQSGDSLVFHYSGHGSQKLNCNGDEADGYDETLCPMDYEIEGMIMDDEINETIVRTLPTGAKLHAIIDACHSGTILDLPFLCKMDRAGFFAWEDHSPRSGAYKGTSGGLAISFSGCDDNQTSADTSALSGNTITGALTYCFIQAVESEPGATYGRLLYAMRLAIRTASTGIRINGPIASLIKTVFGVGLTQEPQLSSSEPFDIYGKQFLL